MEEIIKSLIELVSTASPVLWAAAQQAVRASIVQGVFISITSALLAVMMVLLLRRINKNNEIDDMDRGIYCLFMGGCIVTLVAVSILYVNIVIGLVMAPDYHAIQKLIELVPAAR